MPYIIRKLPNQPYYKVSNKITGEIHSNKTTLDNAKKQVKLLYMIEKDKNKISGKGPVFSALSNSILQSVSAVDALEAEVRRDDRRQQLADRRLMMDQMDAEHSGRNPYPVAPVRRVVLGEARNNIINNIPRAVARPLEHQPLNVVVIPPSPPRTLNKVSDVKQLVQQPKKRGRGIKKVPTQPIQPTPPSTILQQNIMPPPPPETILERDARLRQEGNDRLRKRLVRGGELPSGLNPLEIIPSGLKSIKKKVVEIADKVIKGRNDYPPSAAAILKKFENQEVKSIELHRKVLSVVYTGLLNVLTLGEFNKRLKEQPKDKLFHISMWVKLANGKTILVEKNEVINMKVNPKKEKEEEVQQAGAVPAGLTFGEMLDKAQKQMGSKYFTYSARDNNCGNYIEAVLKANGMNTEATHSFIGQDAKAILKGYPKIAKAMNALTDFAGRANVIKEGGQI